MSTRAIFSYFQGLEGDTFSFYRIPKVLFTNDYFKNLSCEAKVLYGLMIDRMSLSVKNRWFDDEDRVYIIFTIDDVKEKLNCSRGKAIAILDELDNKRGIGLIERKRIGLGKANVIYVKNFVLKEYPDEPAEIDTYSEEENSGNVAEKIKEMPINTQKSKNRTSGSLKNELQEVYDLNFKKSTKRTSASTENGLQEVSEIDGNYTDISYTDNNETESYLSIPHIRGSDLATDEDRIDEIETREQYRQLIRSNIEYDILVQEYGEESVDGLVSLMVDTVCTKKPYVNINGEAMPSEVVRSRLLKIGYRHVQYIYFSMSRNTSKVRNIRQYLLTTLYNAPATMDQFYDAEVRHDMYGG